MPKVAVQFSGMARCLDECYESHLEFFENRNNIEFDFFRHTWDECYYDTGVKERIKKRQNIEVSDNIIKFDKAEMTQRLNSIYNPISLIVESQDNSCQMNNDVRAAQNLHNITSSHPWVRFFEPHSPQKIKPFLNVPQTYSMYQANNSCEEYRQKNSLLYKLTIRTRFDLKFSNVKQDKKFFMEAIERKIYDLHDNSISFSLNVDNKKTFVNDLFFAGAYKGMNFLLSELYRSKIRELYDFESQFTGLQEGFLIKVMNGYNRFQMKQPFNADLDRLKIYDLLRKEV